MLQDMRPASLQVHLVGKQQRQLNDNQYYHAIRFIGARGRVLSAEEIVCYRAQQLSLRRANLGYMPGWSYTEWQASHKSPDHQRPKCMEAHTACKNSS